MDTPWMRRIVFIAAIIVIFSLIGFAIRLAGWLFNLLLPAAALIILIALILSWSRRSRSRKPSTTYKQREPLRISRDTRDKK